MLPYELVDDKNLPLHDDEDEDRKKSRKSINCLRNNNSTMQEATKEQTAVKRRTKANERDLGMRGSRPQSSLAIPECRVHRTLPSP